MEINNKNVFKLGRVFLFLLLAAIAVDLSLSFINGRIGAFFYTSAFEWLGLGLIVLISLLDIRYFYFEAEHEILHLRSKALVSGIFGFKSVRYEFPKTLLKSYKLKKGFLSKTLIIKVKSSRGPERVKKFNVTYLSSKKIKFVVEKLKAIKLKNKQQLNS
jgi:hypothetical protein